LTHAEFNDALLAVVPVSNKLVSIASAGTRFNFKELSLGPKWGEGEEDERERVDLRVD
jgi:hypothetical protein